jgi:hypothetical protein
MVWAFFEPLFDRSTDRPSKLATMSLRFSDALSASPMSPPVQVSETIDENE